MTIFQYRTFLRKANKIISDANKSKQLVAVMLIDFEKLPALDSVLGYHAVDSMLKDAGHRLANALLPTDLVGYVGRYQLACLLSSLPTPSHAELAGHKIIRVLNTPYRQAKQEIFMAARVGISLSKPQKHNLNELLRQANAAVQVAIQEREFLKIYADTTDETSARKLDLFVDLDLERAIEESRVFLAYQPQLELSTNKIIGAETLLRWTHPRRGIILPDVMIHVAERTDLISKLTFWVFNTAMRHCAELHKAGLAIGVNVNFSAHNLREPDLVDVVSEALQLWNIPAHRVGIELTETALMEENQRSLDTLNQLKAMGIRISMDDFGTGYSSMALLGKLPIDEVKIDISFIRELLKRPEQAHIIASMIDLAHALGMTVVAEGVENMATRKRLQDMGCDFIQGYLIGRPMLLPDFISKVLPFNQA